MEQVEHSFKHYVFKNQIVIALLLVLAGWFLLQIKEILILFFIAYILMTALEPYVEFLMKYKIPRSVAAMIAYVLTLGIVVLLIVPIIPFFVSQIESLINSFPIYLDQIITMLHIQVNSTQIEAFLTSESANIGANAFAVTSTIITSIFSVFLVFVVSFYLMIDYNRMRKELTILFPKNDKEKVLATLTQIEEKLGAWSRGQIVLCVFIGFFTWVALTIIGLPFALPLAILAGILEIVPTIGPILAAVPAAIVAISISPGLTFAVIITYIVIQAIENNILVPKIMQRAVGLNPILVILAITIGANLLGILGALLSIPFLSMLIIIGKNVKKTS